VKARDPCRSPERGSKNAARERETIGEGNAERCSFRGPGLRKKERNAWPDTVKGTMVSTKNGRRVRPWVGKKKNEAEATRVGRNYIEEN